jgi:hypothetical protein
MASFQPPKPKYHAQLASVQERASDERVTAAKSVDAAATKKKAKAKSFQAEENKAVTPPPTVASTTTPDAALAPVSKTPSKKDVALACNSTRKKRNRRKTVCFGDWVTGTPPPAISRGRNSQKNEQLKGGETLLVEPAAAQVVTPPPRNNFFEKQQVPKTPSHAEILNMSKELNSLASTLLPETPGTVEKGGLTLKERLAESWCGKSYYERLAEMNSYEGGEESGAEDETIDDLQSALQNALSKTKVSSRKTTTTTTPNPKKKVQTEKSKSNRRKSTRRISSSFSKSGDCLLRRGSQDQVETKCQPQNNTVVVEDPDPSTNDDDKKALNTMEEEENRRKSWADVVADTNELAEEGAQDSQPLALEESTSNQEEALKPAALVSVESDAVDLASEIGYREALDEKQSLIDSLHSKLAEERRKNVVLECQKEELTEEKTHLKASLARLKDFASQLSQQVLELNRELDHLSENCA